MDADVKKELIELKTRLKMQEKRLDALLSFLEEEGLISEDEMADRINPGE